MSHEIYVRHFSVADVDGFSPSEHFNQQDLTMNILQQPALSGGLNHRAYAPDRSQLEKLERVDALMDKIEEFVKSIQQSALQSTTKTVYICRLRTFSNSLCARSLPDTFNSLADDFAAAARHFFIANSYTSNTISGYSTVFKLFAEFNAFEQLNYAANVNRFKVQDPLSAEHFTRFMQSARQHASKRDAFLIHLVAYSPIPLRTILNLRVADITTAQLELSTRAPLHKIQINYFKGKFQYFYIVEHNYSDLAAAWMDTLDISSPDTLLFPGSKGSALSLTAADHAIRSLGWKCRLRVSVRQLRAAARDAREMSTAAS